MLGTLTLAFAIVVQLSAGLANADCNCGISGANRIVGGGPAAPNEFPWHAIVGLNNTYLLGGVVLTDRHVATTARRTENGFFCVVTNDFARLIPAIKTFRPPGNDFGFHEDIRIIELAEPLTSDDGYSPICLPLNHRNYDFAGQIGTTIGWGMTDPNVFAVADSLQKVDIPIISAEACKQFSAVSERVSNKTICTYQAGSGKSFCHSDQGGALSWKDPTTGRHFLVGTSSSAENGCDGVGVYTLVTKYLDWIAEVTGRTFCSP